MSNILKSLVASASMILAGTVAANAALLDFTDDSVPLVGTYKGIGYTITGVPVAPNRNQAFDGDASMVDPRLELDNDGFGIRDDEINYLQTASERITITFDRAVTVTGLHFLDLFEAPGASEEEVAIVNSDGLGVALTFDALQEKVGNNPGYAFASVGSIKGSVWTFEAGDTNDQFGDPDYALAGLEIAPIPVPAAGLLLLGGLGALGFVKRRKA